MKYIKKLKNEGFAHWIIPSLVVIAVGGVGAYLALTGHAATNYAGMCGTGYKLKMSQKPSQYNKVLIYTKQSGDQTDWCAYTVRIGAAEGVKDWTYIGIFPYHQYDKGDTEQGQFEYYAGPARLSNVKKIDIGTTVNFRRTGTGYGYTESN